LQAGFADHKQVTWWIALFLLQDVKPQTSQLQNAQSQAERVRAAMEGSLEKQRASVRQQAKSAGTSMTPWTDVAMPAAVLSPQAFCEAIVQPELIRMIDNVASRQDIDPSLVREVARQESGFRPCAVSAKGAEGLMQLMPQTQAQLDVQDPFHAQESLEAGSKLLKQLLDRYDGDLSLALSAYNAGPYRVDKAGGIPEIPETKNYVSSILDRLKQ
jgi:soluble lytic murein transglycosylase-like protein